MKNRQKNSYTSIAPNFDIRNDVYEDNCESIRGAMKSAAGQVNARTSQRSLDDLLDPRKGQQNKAQMRVLENEISNLLNRAITIFQVCADPRTRGCDGLRYVNALMDACESGDPVVAKQAAQHMDTACEECRFWCPARAITGRLIKVFDVIAKNEAKAEDSSR